MIIILGIIFCSISILTYILAWGFVVPPTYEGLREANCVRSELKEIKDIGGNAKVRENDLLDFKIPLEALLYFWLCKKEVE